jgi:L-ascorbate metabolism protein UlaG (beta-lactamase superfamily)
MQLIARGGIDVAFLPIGDNFTMGPEDSLQAIEFIRPRYVVPMHYKTWPPIDQDASAWANRVSSETSAQPIVLDPGASFTLT